MHVKQIDSLSIEIIDDNERAQRISKLCRKIDFILSNIIIKQHYFVSRPHLSFSESIKPETSLPEEVNLIWNLMYHLSAKGKLNNSPSQEYEICSINIFDENTIINYNLADINIFAYDYTEDNSCSGILSVEDNDDTQIGLSITIPLRILLEIVSNIKAHNMMEVKLQIEIHSYQDDYSVYIEKNKVESILINSISF